MTATPHKEAATLRGFTVLGHRGAKGHAPENTLASFAKALELGATMVELDIHLSRDGHLVVIHDADVARTTNGSGLVADLTLAEIRQLDAGSWFHPSFAGQRVPTLGEVWDFLAGRLPVNVEIKKGPRGPHDGIVERLAEFLVGRGALQQVVVSSFEPSYLRQLRQLLPDVQIALLYHKPLPDPCRLALDEGWQALHPHLSCVTPALVEQAHAQGLLVRGWNPNTAPEMEPLLDAGVDGIGTDFPEILRALAEARGLLPRRA